MSTDVLKKILLPSSGAKSKPSKKPESNRQQAMSAEDGGDMFFLNVGEISTDCTLLYPRTQWRGGPVSL
jgi:hypothetical protein